MKIDTKYGPILLDDEDAHFLELGSVYTHPSHDFRVFLLKSVCVNGRWRTRKLNLSRLIMGLPLKDRTRLVDHKDRNKMNCQKSNMRVCSALQNNWNRSRNIRGTSKFKGVCFKADRLNPWVAQIQINHKKLHIGYFNSEIDAALAYDTFAARHFGEFAVLNKPSVAFSNIRPR